MSLIGEAIELACRDDGLRRVNYEVLGNAQPLEPLITIERLATCSLVLPRPLGDETRRAANSPSGRSAPVSRSGRASRSSTRAPRSSSPRAAYGDTLVTTALVDVLGYRDRLACRPLDPPLQEVFAFIQGRHTRLSPRRAH